MIVLGRLKASFIIHFASLFGLSNILLCYILAVLYKHVPLWLPMISSCAVEPPEKYIFRLGLVTTSLLIALVNVMIFVAAVPRDKLALTLSVVSCLALSVVGVVNEKEVPILHSGKESGDYYSSGLHPFIKIQCYRTLFFFFFFFFFTIVSI